MWKSACVGIYQLLKCNVFTARYERNRYTQFKSIQTVKNAVPLGLTICRYILKTFSYKVQFPAEIKVGDIQSRNNTTVGHQSILRNEMQDFVLCRLAGIEIHYREAQPYPETGRRRTYAWMRLCLRSKRMNNNGVSMLTAVGLQV